MLGLKGKYIMEIKRANGEVEVIEFDNVVTKEGKNYLLKAGVLGTETPITGWYIGLIGTNIAPSEDDKASTALGAGGSYGEVVAYNEASRQPYNAIFDSANNRIINSTSPVSFTINANNTNIYGAFVVSSQVKNSNTGILLSAGVFSGVKVLGADDQITITYIINS